MIPSRDSTTSTMLARIQKWSQSSKKDFANDKSRTKGLAGARLTLKIIGETWPGPVLNMYVNNIVKTRSSIPGEKK